MEEADWITVLHSFASFNANLKLMFINQMFEMRSVVVVLLGIEFLIYRIDHSYPVLGRNTEIIEELFETLKTCVTNIFNHKENISYKYVFFQV